ncbi:MAG: CBS domain-containing protein [Deltaproteobacteria bacterium]|uniref:CBS domain-containing protein n=1 Tax=Desulfobacula sp. TaxID=2593537 RepID=UPI0019BD209B|nr:CBS domain-containing protein [Candidatus Desulfobacula maris]MBL6995052.1 CBS domain-containing protein [Desulfobacula sp.]
MKTILVKDLMVPLSEYATVDEDATLSEALDALEKAQEQFDKTKYRHRAILVCEKKSNKVVGKISQLDVIRSLEPKYDLFMEEKAFPQTGMSHFGFSPKFMQGILDQYQLWYDPLKDICGKAGTQKVTEIMHTPTAGEYVKETANLGEAIHLIIMGHHQSLLVTKKEEIVGILRLTDIFKEICIDRRKMHQAK